MKNLLRFFAVMLVSALGAVAAEKSPTLPEYPGQPSINSALKDLTKAKEIIETNKDDALVHLKKAASSLESSIKDKGNYRTTAIRWTKQAIRHLEQSDTPKAVREIDEAIKDTHQAGKVGAK